MLTVCFLLCLAAPVQADAPKSSSRPKDTSDLTTDDRTPYVELLGAMAGGMVHRHGVGAVDAVVAAGGWNVRLAIVAPIRFDRDGLRREDWDERADYGRILGELSYGRRGDALFASLAPVRAWHLGTGTLVTGFESTVDPDHWRTGAVASLQWQPAGVEVFLDSFLDPQVLGGRANVHPLFWIDGDGYAGRLEFGFTVVSDLSAPVSRNASEVDRVGLPVHDREPIVAGGIDFRYPVFRTSQVEVTPYAAWSRLGSADGAQVGLAIQAAPVKSFTFALLGEWRWLDPHYVGAYFDAAYMADRQAFDTVPKWRALDVLKDGRMGMRFGLSLGFPPYVTTWARLDIDQAGAFSTFGAGLDVDIAERGRLSAALHTRGFVTAADFVRPDRTLASISGSARLWRWFDAFARYDRDLGMRRSGRALGCWEASDSFLFGLRVAFGWTFRDGRATQDSGRAAPAGSH